MTVNKAVALRIAELLAKNKMSQYRLEQTSGLSHSRISCIMHEKNKTVTLSTIILLAEGFDMTVQEFLASPLFDHNNLDAE